MDIRAVLMGVAFAFFWSSAFTSARIIVAYAPPLSTLAVRFLISGLIAIVIARLLGQTWRLTPAQWWATIIFGVCQNVLYLGLNFFAMQTVEASLAAIIASALPLLVALFGRLFFDEKIRPLGYLGLFAGMLGVVLIMGSRLSVGVDPIGVIMCVVGAVALTFATLMVRSATSGGNLLMIVGLQMLVGAVGLAIVGLPFETLDVEWRWELIAAFAYTTIFPGLIATVIWFKLVERIGSIRASTYHFLNPFMGVAVAAILLSEQLGQLDLIAVAIITGGIFIVQMAKQR